jgi:hypothetical protein
MRNTCNNRVVSNSCAFVFAIGIVACASALAAATAELSGQWVGSSGIEGGRSGDKTTLALGAPEADNSTLRIEGRTTCTLRDGSYSAAADGAWTLSFKGANGTEACERLARGKFTLRQDAPRKLSFEASYPGPDGTPNQRSGVLSRYP